PFEWQLRAAATVLVHDIGTGYGTGCGKSLCFVLPLLMHEHDLGITVVQLTALMLGQSKNGPYPSAARLLPNADAMRSKITIQAAASGEYQHIICLPEIFKTPSFRKNFMKKLACLRVVCVDEAHWGFRTDYLEMAVVSTQLCPACGCVRELHIRRSVGLSTSGARISIPNARQNIALSVFRLSMKQSRKISRIVMSA
ncbi:hypothetical protein GGX14DRAFT_348139, partial [Mycena pura]